MTTAKVQSWRANVLDGTDQILDLVRTSQRIAVLGIKPESRAHKPAHSVPRYLQSEGYDIIPVPVYYPEVTTILGNPVYRLVAPIPGQIDIVNVFRKPHDIPPHLDDLVSAAPRAVWFQLGIRNDDAAKQLAQAGILVVQDRCTAIEHSRLAHP